ncbi:DUF4491 family protein [Bacteroides sp. OttesenSCG-928-D19]|nr:DUF4491 family protein [Bacteroides sp. OttesenSCG-928-D19]
MEFLTTYNLTGLTIGIATFLVIGLFHPIVIKAEYYCGTKCWWIFLLAGFLCVGLSVFIKEIFLSTLMGVVAFSCFWSILEIFEQKERVRKGWFPENPKRRKKNLQNPPSEEK